VTGGDYQIRSDSTMRRLAALPESHLDDLYGPVLVMDRSDGDEAGEITGIARAAGTCTVDSGRYDLRRILPRHPISQATAYYLLAMHREHMRVHAGLREAAARRNPETSREYCERHAERLAVLRRRYDRLVACLREQGLATTDPAC
jgi:hypothetical protein